MKENKILQEPLVAIMMCTYNGVQFLKEQLDSFLTQTHKNIIVIASDDGSTDSTIQILEQYKPLFGKDSNNNDRLRIINGPKSGSVINFLSILCMNDLSADYYAFSDQDDIWENDKITRALHNLKEYQNIPVLYGSRTRTVSYDNQDLGFSTIFSKSPSFKNAIVQSIAGGNTMIMNMLARNLLKEFGPLDVVSHDWWAYIVVSGAGGKMIYDTYPSLRYRQHGNNQIGANTSWFARIKRINLLLKGKFRKWNSINVEALMTKKNLLSKENQEILDEFDKARNSHLISRITGLWKIGIYRQTFLGNLGLILAVILNKL